MGKTKSAVQKFTTSHDKVVSFIDRYADSPSITARKSHIYLPNQDGLGNYDINELKQAIADNINLHNQIKE